MKRMFPLFFLFLTSCASPATYFQNRLYDGMDIFHIKFTFGPGLLVGARATQGLSVGLGITPHVQKYGIRGRGIGHWEEYRGEAGIMAFGIPLSFYYLKDVKKRFVSGNRFLREELENPKPSPYRVFPVMGVAWWPLESSSSKAKEGMAALEGAQPFLTDRKLTEVGVTVHCIAFGVDVGIDLLEIFDFLLGWFGLDFQGDDLGSSEREFRYRRWGEEEKVEKEKLQAKGRRSEVE